MTCFLDIYDADLRFLSVDLMLLVFFAFRERVRFLCTGGMSFR